MKDQAARAAAGKAVAGLWARLQEALSGLLIEIRWRVCTRVHSQLQLDSLLELDVMVLPVPHTWCLPELL